MGKTLKKIETAVIDCSGKDASNDPVLRHANKGGNSPGYAGSSLHLDAPQAANLTEGMVVELRTVECTMNLFADDINRSLENTLRLDFCN